MQTERTASTSPWLPDEVDRRLIAATQGGLPLDPQPYHRVAEQVGVTPVEVMARLRTMMALGVIRRIGAVPNHYRLGYRANAMTVWDVSDKDIRCAGREVGALDFVSHCYHRPRHPPDWPYNLFAMVHGHDREEVAAMIARIQEVLGGRQRGYSLLYSTRILKKTGLRVGQSAP